MRSSLMSRIRGSNTTPERYVASLLAAGKIGFRQHDPELPGRPDLVFDRSRVAVFIEGDFWHGWRFPQWRHKLSPKWRTKIEMNRLRDTRNHRKLRRNGWRVLRMWEHQVEADVLQCITKILDCIGVKRADWAGIKECYAKLPKIKRRNRLPKP
jgi:DNA mismatch endonuclease (patch repair protein)